MFDRYLNRKIIKNNLDMYKNTLEKRGLKFLDHYNTYKFSYKDENKLAYMDTFSHIWSIGDRYYKLSYRYYNTVNDWWIIALYNNKPTESDIMIGETIYIPADPVTFLKNIKK
jgi:hypothetical protein